MFIYILNKYVIEINIKFFKNVKVRLKKFSDLKY